jgi:alkylation response protein AidB-like acyl-CoA dehydrogenase
LVFEADARATNLVDDEPTDDVPQSSTPRDSLAGKPCTTNVQCHSIDNCLQLFGGYGYTNQNLTRRMYTRASSLRWRQRKL